MKDLTQLLPLASLFHAAPGPKSGGAPTARIGGDDATILSAARRNRLRALVLVLTSAVLVVVSRASRSAVASFSQLEADRKVMT